MVQQRYHGTPSCGHLHSKDDPEVGQRELGEGGPSAGQHLLGQFLLLLLEGGNLVLHCALTDESVKGESRLNTAEHRIAQHS